MLTQMKNLFEVDTTKTRLLTALAVIWLSAVLLLLPAQSRCEESPGTPAREKRARFQVVVRNTLPSLVSGGEIVFVAPVQRTARQHCQSLESSLPHEVKTDHHRNQFLHVALPSVPPFATKIVRLQASLLYGEPLRETMVSQESRTYLEAEELIEADHPKIIERAIQLQGKDRQQTARRIFDWVAANVRYSGYLKQGRGALYALEKGVGDCTEYMALFVALCRASGIPARGVGGYVCSTNCAPAPAAYHNWAEFLLDGTWRISDPQEKLFMENEENYIAMQIIDPVNGAPLVGVPQARVVGDGLILTHFQ